MSTILELKDVHKKYDNGTHAVRGVSFSVKKGEFLSVIGLSGSGKSTLLRCINRLHNVTSGSIVMDGEEVTKLKKKEVLLLRKDAAMIFQHFNLINRHSALSNVLMGTLSFTPTIPSLLGLFSSEDVKRAKEYLDLVGISGKMHARVDQLSGGQKQRVAIARALMQRPKILLADEPVASLDPATCHVVLDYLKKINKELGLTILCNLHFLSLVREYSDRALALKEGKLLFDGSVETIDDSWFKKIYGEKAQEVHIS